MARPRSELSAILHGLCDHVYFQPPTGKMLEYPCIIYNLDGMDVRHADNGPYQLYDEYSITYITRDPDDANIRSIALLPLCRMSNTSSINNLHHSYYKLYF